MTYSRRTNFRLADAIHPTVGLDIYEQKVFSTRPRLLLLKVRSNFKRSLSNYSRCNPELEGDKSLKRVHLKLTVEEKATSPGPYGKLVSEYLMILGIGLR